MQRRSRRRVGAVVSGPRRARLLGRERERELAHPAHDLLARDRARRPPRRVSPGGRRHEAIESMRRVHLTAWVGGAASALLRAAVLVRPRAVLPKEERRHRPRQRCMRHREPTARAPSGRRRSGRRRRRIDAHCPCWVGEQSARREGELEHREQFSALRGGSGGGGGASGARGSVGGDAGGSSSVPTSRLRVRLFQCGGGLPIHRCSKMVGGGCRHRGARGFLCRSRRLHRILGPRAHHSHKVPLASHVHQPATALGR